LAGSPETGDGRKTGPKGKEYIEQCIGHRSPACLWLTGRSSNKKRQRAKEIYWDSITSFSRR